ncbi:MAG: hypothetical protein ACPGJI_05065, partial [Kangiellaceae bacterium]
ALGEHDSAYVDAYYGPQEWLQQAKENKLLLAEIIERSKALLNDLQSHKSSEEMLSLRVQYLKTQLSTLKAYAVMKQSGNKLDFDAQSRALYDTEAPHFKLSEFDKTLASLNKLLPGDKSLIEKAKIFDKQFVIPRDKLNEVFKIAIDACQQRTRKFIQLLDKETFKLEYVQDKPWSGYNWYKGNAYSLIQINNELPIDISRAIDLGCHEGYPGHHTYNALLEANLVKKRGWLEFSVYPLFSPQSLIAEGSANYGIDMAFPGEEKIQFEKEKLYPIAGIDPKLADTYAQYSKLKSKLNYAGNELARLYLNGKVSKEKVVPMLQRYTLVSKEKAEQRVKFWDTYGAYVINYNWGKDLVKNWIESGSDQSEKGRWKRFTRLLSSPLLPSSLK